jgi:photosynthetic reaction center cytochrome c subunit
MRTRITIRRLGLAAACLATLALAGCEIPATQKDQWGYRGTAMVNVQNPRTQEELRAANVMPEPAPPAPDVGPKAGEIYQNVQVLQGLTVPQFTRLMTSITNWVSPEQGCGYCHNLQNMAEDNYQKTVARSMLQMTQTINSQWQAHVAQTGVTCYTCHRGQPVPAEIWFEAPQTVRARFAGGDGSQNMAGPINSASLPIDPFSPFLLDSKPIRVEGSTPVTRDNRTSIKQTEWTFSLMVHMSEGLGVNCTYCHNTRNFAGWSESTPQRVTAWHGIRMANTLNNDYLVPLTSVFPAHRLGPKGDVAKINCATCHQGVNKPLYGQSMLAAYPALAAPVPVPAPPVEVPAEGDVPATTEPDAPVESAGTAPVTPAL